MGDICLLLVEDSRVDAEFFKVLLKDAGILNPNVVQNLDEAQSFVEGHPEISIIFSDLTLPASDQFNTIAWLEQVSKTIPAIAFTGSVDRRVAEQLGTIGIPVINKHCMHCDTVLFYIWWSLARMTARKEIQDSLRQMSDSLQT